MNPGPYSTWPALLTSPNYPDNAQVPGYDPGAYMPGYYGDYGGRAAGMALMATATPTTTTPTISGGTPVIQGGKSLPPKVRSLAHAQMAARWANWQDNKAGKTPGKTWTRQKTIVGVLQAAKADARQTRTKKAISNLAYEYWRNVEGGGGRASAQAPPTERVPVLQRPGTTTFLTALLQGAGVVPREAAAAAVPYEEPAGLMGGGGLPKWVVPVAIGGGILVLGGIFMAISRRRK
jgi:hypothetical protein